MKKLTILLSLFVVVSAFANDKPLKSNFIKGTPEVKSINALAFGPEGILFIGDSKSAAIYAIDTEDMTRAEAPEELKISSFDQKVAEVLGTAADQIVIQDMVVNPLSKNIYVAVHHSNGTPVLLRLKGETFEPVSMENISYSNSALNNPIGEDAEDRRGRPLRNWAISDLNYNDGQVMVTGLSNQEFGSTFRAMPFPFQDDQMMASLEIYHAAHGQFETQSPVKAFTTAQIEKQDYVIAAYTCTPLVVFPKSDLKPGEHIKGRTVAELGNWNTPLDMIVMEKEGKSYLLMANSNRAVMKIDLTDVSGFSGSLTERVEERGGTAGVDFIALPFVNVLQLDTLDDENFVMLQRQADGNLQLWTSSNRWL